MAPINGPYPLHAVRLRFKLLGTANSNVYHFGEVVPGAVRDQEINLLDMVTDWWRNAPFGDNPPNFFMGFDSSVVQGWVGIAQLVFEAPILGDLTDLFITGLQEAALLPNNVTFPIEWTTSYGGRSGHGRTFVCGLPSVALDPSDQALMEHDFLTDMVAAYNRLILHTFRWPPVEGSICLAVPHRHGLPRPAPLSRFWSPVTGTRVPQVTVGSLRSRLVDRPGTGPLWPT
jgi:hypothetical protein